MKWKRFPALLVLCEGNLIEGIDKRTASNWATVTFYEMNIVNFSALFNNVELDYKKHEQ